MANGNEFEIAFYNKSFGADLFNSYAEEGTPPSPPTVDFLIQTINNDFIIQTDGSNIIVNT